MTNPEISGKVKPLSLFVGGLNKNLTEREIKNYILKKVGIATVNAIEPIKENPYNKSYRIDVPLADKIKVMNPDNWPQGIIIKPFCKPMSQSYTHHNRSIREQHQQYENRNISHQQYPSRSWNHWQGH